MLSERKRAGARHVVVEFAFCVCVCAAVLASVLWTRLRFERDRGCPLQRLYNTIMAKRGDDLINAAEKGLVDRIERLINVYGADVNHVPSDQPPPPITKPT